MSVWGVTMMRNEEDVAEAVLMHMISEGVDGLVVADNLSTDGTRAALHEVSRMTDIDVVIVDDQIPGFYQGQKMTSLAHIAAERGAEWIIPFDADELWCGISQPFAHTLKHMTSSPIVGVDTWTHVPTDCDPTTGNPFNRLVYRRPHPSSLPKLCYRYCPDWSIHQGNDAIVASNGQHLPFSTAPRDMLQIRHFPHRSLHQFVKKMRQGAAAYAAAPELDESLGSHWRKYGVMDADELRQVFWTHWSARDPRVGFVHDPAPWCRWPR